MIDRVDEVVASTDVLNDVLGRYCDVDVHVIDLDAWTAADLVSVQILMDGELQRRHDEEERIEEQDRLLGLVT